jgi:Fic family protein
MMQRTPRVVIVDISRSIARDTALRDINDLLQRGLLTKNDAGGRSTSYSLAEGEGE